MTDRFAAVALPLPVAEPYRYRIPPALADRALPGARVVVPVRQREMIGIITAVDDIAPDATPRDLLALPDDEPALSAPLLALAAEAARHWGCPPGLMLRAMLPGPLWGRTTVTLRLGEVPGGGLGGAAGALVDWLRHRGGHGTVQAASRALHRPVWEVADRLRRVGALTIEVAPPDVRGGAATERVAVLVGDPLTLTERERRFHRAPARRALYQALEDAGGRQSVAALIERAGTSAAPLKALVESGVVAYEEEEVSRDPFAALATTPPPATLTDAQQRALQALGALAPGEAGLLFGVTGSGKTAVYLERIRQLLREDRGAILLVPEIALTPQTVARVRGAFGDEVAVLHSGLSDNERADAWRMLRRGDRRVAVGARSAVFAPVARLGVIVLDEEHEASYKNGETPRYHARDIARMRARLEGATLVLGSATPSLESWVRISGPDHRVMLPTRIGGHPLPPVELVDLRHEPSIADSAVPWTAPLDEAVTTSLSRGEQVLLLLNRRGWASFIQCPHCGATCDCPQCSITLTVHRHPEQLRCHYCDHRAAVPTACRECGAETTRHRGAGTQQLERLMAERFPSARLARMDLDTTSTRWSHHHILERVGRGEVDILLGTQMIAKGIDFPNVTLVGVIDADLALHLPDFRASERTFQLVAQVAGRAGRGPKGGRVMVQSRQPEHPALVRAAAHDAEGFLADELVLRQSPAYPPCTALARVVVTGADQQAVMTRAIEFGEWSERAIARSGRALLVLGPAPCPIERIRNEWRAHLLVKGEERDLAAWVRTVGPRLSGRRGEIRLSLDRDPVSLL